MTRRRRCGSIVVRRTARRVRRPARDRTADAGRPAHRTRPGDEAAPLYQQVFAADPSNPMAAYRVGALAERDETERAARILLGLARNP